ncbi:uracil-xanthine permease family protein [Aeromicrobium chenweiae]|uniref:Nitrate reductase n=1 Tax=Aeromicrobium chenweiae TaxID=2079793 RepID=A0A2S0WNB0_9ACTN|nr:solute carrier family 23 protein [Aeromicrobium chenweiae]AWB92833.1 nitrate reductase [Aeromicrobium chenweiae]TGN33827.1 nitrate reductase [Aeromicrobium chenweiae]
MPLPWTLHGDGRTITEGEIVAPGERLSWPRTIGFGAQHVVAMFGATFLVPIITGFPPSTTIFFSGVGTLLFLVLTGNRLPSYLGSSFAFLAPIAAAKAGGDDIGTALFGVAACGVLLALVGVLVLWTGTGWIQSLMPPVVAGSIVALIGFNLSGAATDNFEQAPWTALVTLAVVLLVAVFARGLVARLSIVIGVVAGYVVAAFAGALDFTEVKKAAWVGLPEFQSPEFAWSVLPAFLPVVLVLIAENVGHVRSVAQLAEDDTINQTTGRALLADGLATTLAGAAGGSGTTTYGENIGVMAATRVYSTAAYWVAGILAILLGLSPKIGEVIRTVPPGVLGGVTVALYGLIGIIGIKIWIDNNVDFSKPVNQFTAAVALVIGIGDLRIVVGDMEFTGIALGAIAAIVVFHVMTTVERARAR